MPSDLTASSWPAVAYERLVWDTRGRSFAGTRADRERMHGTYRAAIPAEIAARSFVPSAALAGAVDDATAELARYDSELAGRPTALDGILLRSESAASSQIENLTASARSIGLAELGDASRRNATLVVANTRAMRHALDLADELSVGAVLAMHAALLGETDPEGAGRWREEPVWIGRSSLSPIGADFVAPAAYRVPGLMNDLIGYANRTDQPVLVQAALAHAQFETIHPFVDGNGRVGRALLHAMLRHHGLTRHLTVPVSAGLLGEVAGYHAALTAYRAGEPEAIIERTVDATFRAINNGRRLADRIEQIWTQWRGQILARADSAVWRVSELFLDRPVLDAAEVSRELGIAPTNVHRYLDQLTETGVLTRFALYRRGYGWRADDVLAELDAFAARAGRRSAP